MINFCNIKPFFEVSYIDVYSSIIPGLSLHNKCDTLADSNNDMPIGTATIVAELYESIILYKCKDFLSTCDNIK